MSYGKMPPQAYTKETLQEAFEWWSEQPDELRSQIQDKDDLVGYYLKVCRGVALPKKEGGFTKAAKDSFSSELKGLVKNLDAFEGYEDKKGSNPNKRPTQHKPQSLELPKSSVFEPLSSQLQFPEMSNPLVAAAVEDVPSTASPALVATDVQSQFFRLDGKSKESVAQAKQILNLSSDEEALRALIALGDAKIKGLI